MAEHRNNLLVVRPLGAIEKAAPGAKRILSGMVADALHLVKKTASKEIAISDAQVESWYQTGAKYSFGRGVPQDHAEAVKWFRKAAEQNHVMAQSSLGYCYDAGEGVAKDYVEAVKWYRKAAEQGHHFAQHNLALCYTTGQGVKQNYEEAFRWYCEAVKSGEAKTQFNVGGCYFLGQGVAMNYIESYKWLKLAAEQGDKAAIEFITRLFSGDDLRRSELAYREFCLSKK
ncbi:MAG: tetratricopeptide repeat protein [Verrucomicrobiota bacterium]